jgi:hypothetical protein
MTGTGPPSRAEDDHGRDVEDRRNVAAVNVERLLADLPESAGALAVAFRRAVSDGMRRGRLRPELVEPSFCLGQPSFRALVNVATNRRDDRAFSEAIRFGDSLGLGGLWWKAATVDWLSREERDLHFGVACGPSETRQKIYFLLSGATGPEFHSPASFVTLLRQFRAPEAVVAMARSESDRRLVAACTDFGNGDVVGYKLYWHVAVSVAHPLFASGLLWRFLESEVDLNRISPLTLCRRYDASGKFENESLYARLSKHERSTNALTAMGIRYARACGAEAEARWIEQRSDSIRCFIVSETADDAGGRHVYFLAAV